MISVPGVLLAQLIASRKEPKPVSFVLKTMLWQVPGCNSVPTLNSEVLPALSVAVATILSKVVSGATAVNKVVFVVVASAAVYVSNPKNVWPCFPLASARKNSMRKGYAELTVVEGTAYET